MTYVESNHIIELANNTFGFSGWSSSVLDLTVDFVSSTNPCSIRDAMPAVQCEERNGRWHCGLSAIVRVTLKNGCYHEDIGWGLAVLRTLQQYRGIVR